jgi:hypothetical protein
MREWYLSLGTFTGFSIVLSDNFPWIHFVYFSNGIGRMHTIETNLKVNWYDVIKKGNALIFLEVKP